MPSRAAARQRPAAVGFDPLTLALMAGVWIATLGNWPLWRALAALPEMASGRGWLFVGGFCVTVAALTTALLALAAWRPVIKPVIAFFCVSAAVGAHFMGSYGVVIDPTMMQNVVQTNASETRDLLSWRLLMSVLLLGGVPVLAMVWMPLRRRGWLAQLGRNALALVAAVVVMAAVVIALFADLSSTMRNHKSLRYLINPVNSYYALGVLAAERKAQAAGPPQPIGLDARPAPRGAGTKPPLLMLVIGETARADHFSLNGYARATNPELGTLPVTSFRQVTSCGTNTAASLPCMFSHLGRKAYLSRDGEHENLLDLVQRAGLAVLWLDNQSGCKGLCDRVPNASTGQAPAGAPPLPAGWCAGGECLDAALLHGLDQRLAALPAARRAQGVLLVLHQMGSHGPAYAKRSPPERKPFLPECTTNVLQQCEHAGLINAYDNSIAYTDHVLAQAIGWLQRQHGSHDPALLYVSDHGESLGENNLYLHGLPYAVAPAEQTHVPLITWLPAPTQRDLGITAACVDAGRDEPLSHDHLFHTVLGLLRVQAGEYRAPLDLLSPCRKAP